MPRFPKHPWASLIISALLGPHLATLIVAALTTPSRSDTPSLWQLFGEAVSVGAFSYFFVVPIVALYAAPLLWAALRFQIAHPLLALVIGLGPGAVIFAVGWTDTMYWLFLAGSVTITAMFVYLAYFYRWTAYDRFLEELSTS